MAAAETFSNQATTTVTFGGTDAPSGGTSQTWTVTSSATFPAAATGVTQFRVCDQSQAASSEIILVTNVSGTTWTVTRGAEGSTPVAHAPGFTIFADLTAGVLQQFLQSSSLPLAIASGGTGSATAAVNTVFAGPSTGSPAAPSYRAIASADLPPATITNPGAVTLPPTATRLPQGWDAQWKIGKAAGIAATGTAKVAIAMGDSYSAGQSATPVTDCLRYGWVGRLKTMLLGEMGLAAHGYTIASVNPGTLTSPSSPYGSSAWSGTGVADGGIGQVWVPSSNGSWNSLTTVQDVDTLTYPNAADLLSLDFNTNGWSYTVDGGSSVPITTAGSSNYTGLIRRTSITGLSSAGTHTIALSNGGSNGLMFIGHVAYYGSTGLALMRNGISGYKAADFALGGGSAAGVIGAVTPGVPEASTSTDHIKPWAGYYAASGDSFPCFANSASAGGFPWQNDLVVIMIGGNDCTYGSPPGVLRQAVTRQIHAARRGIPASGSNGPGASVLIIGEPYVSEYSDNASAISTSYPNPTSAWQSYKSVLRDLADEYTCGWVDTEVIFGETPVARGFMASGQVHATQNGSGAGGGDGHYQIALSVFGVL